MKKMLSEYIILLSLSLVAIMALIPSGVSVALDCSQPNLSTHDAIQCGTNGASGSNQTPDQATTTASSTISNLINLLSAAVGVLAVIMIIIAGLRYITSGGKQESVTGAKNTILYAIIGLVIVALAQLIVHFVLNKTTTSTCTINPVTKTCITP